MKDRRASVIISEEVFQLKRRGFGALTHPAIERWIAGTLLFSRMEHLCNNELIALRDSCLPHYKELCALSNRLLSDHPDSLPRLPVETKISATAGRSELVLITTWKTLVKASSQHHCAGMLRDALESWVRQQNLYTEWFLDALVKLLGAWRLDPHTAEEPQFFMTGSLSRSPNRRLATLRRDLDLEIERLAPRTGSFPVPVYNPAAQTRNEHAAEVAERLLAYHQGQEELFKAAGFSPSQPKRERTRGAWEDLDWFIRYQVLDEATEPTTIRSMP